MYAYEFFVGWTDEAREASIEARRKQSEDKTNKLRDAFVRQSKVTNNASKKSREQSERESYGQSPLRRTLSNKPHERLFAANVKLADVKKQYQQQIINHVKEFGEYKPNSKTSYHVHENGKVSKFKDGVYHSPIE